MELKVFNIILEFFTNSAIAQQLLVSQYLSLVSNMPLGKSLTG